MPVPAFSQIATDVIEILKRVSARPIEPTLESEIMKDLAFNSIQVLEFVAEIEEHFDVNVPLNKLAHVKTVRQIAETLEALCVQREGAV